MCEFQESLGWPQNLISHHLGALRRAGLVQARRDAQWVYYSLVPEGYARARRLVGDTLGPTRLPAGSARSAQPHAAAEGQRVRGDTRTCHLPRTSTAVDAQSCQAEIRTHGST